MPFLQRFLTCMRGATAIEYVLIVAGISLAIVVVVFAFGEDLANLFKTVEEAFQQAEPVE